MKLMSFSKISWSGILLLSCLVLFSCRQFGQQSQSSEGIATNQPIVYPKDTFKAGVVLPSVSLRIDSTQTYALYLPIGYSDTIKYPVMIFFDPHGDGALPLNLYHELADKYHFVFLGSNNSKNLVDYNQTTVFANNLVQEARTRYSTDERQMAFAGFSGGAKVAMLAGQSNPFISAIVYCGACADITPDHLVTLIGIAGTRDMNYTDLASYNWGLEKTKIPHLMLEWNGKHEFPTAAIFKDAFDFLMTGKIEDFDKKQITISKERVNQELTVKQKYVAAFQKKESIEWWKKEIAGLNAKKNSDPMSARLLGFISLACYSFGNTALQRNNIDDLGRIVEIYKAADPTNKDCDTLNAAYNQRKKGP